MDDQLLTKDQTQKQTGVDSLINKLYQPGPLVCFFVILLGSLLFWAYTLLTTPTHSSPLSSESLSLQAAATVPISTANKVIPKTKNQSVASTASNVKRVFEEAATDLEDQVRQVDLAIIETLRAAHIDLNQLGLLDVAIREHKGKRYHHQTLQLPFSLRDFTFKQKLLKNLHKRVHDAVITDNGKNELDISIATITTHRLLTKKPSIAHNKPSKEHAHGPKLVVVIDDIGENLQVLKGLLRVNLPLTYAVWPHATYTRVSVSLIQKAQRDLIIHFPMEPQGYPRYRPGKDALFTQMTAKEIILQIEENLAQIPEAIGVNNHMGSKFTSYTAGMRVALQQFKKHHIFFLDSLTSAKSAGRSVAKEVAIPFYERDIFIDNVKDVNAIMHQLKKAENVAMKKGYAIAIGHPYKETLAAIEAWSNKRNLKLHLIPLSQLPPQ